MALAGAIPAFLNGKANDMSKKLNLMLHCGASRVDFAQVFDSPTPPATKTHYPVAHAEYVDRVRHFVGESGLRIDHEEHGLTKEGARYFGMLQVSQPVPVPTTQAGLPVISPPQEPDGGLVIGLRNSHDKTFPLAIALGFGVFVCDNLSFSGEIKLARKHTRFALRDLPALVSRAVGMLGDHRRKQELRLDTYRNRELCDVEAHDLIVRAIDARVITPTKIPAVIEQWRQPNHPEFADKTAWRLFNAFTEQFKAYDASVTLNRSQRLHGLLDAHCDLAV